MSNGSFATQAVAKGPMTLAPSYLDGHRWLVVINLKGMTAVGIVAAMFAVDACLGWRRNRSRDLWNHPVTIWRVAGFCFAPAIVVRCGGEATLL